MKLRYVFFLFLLVAVPLFILRQPQFYAPLHGLALTLFKPVMIAAHSVSYAVANIRESSAQFWNTFQNQSKYENRIQQLESRLIQLQELEKENQRLKELLNFKESLNLKSYAARVIGWDLSLLRKTVVIDKGQVDGIRKGMPVVVSSGLVGRVLDANPATARVLLLTDPDARVSAVSQNSRSQGVVSGNGSPVLSMHYLDLDSGVEIGEAVLSSGVGGIFPEGFLIGKIEELGRDPTGLHLMAKIIPFVSFDKLEEVLCIDYSAPK